MAGDDIVIRPRLQGVPTPRERAQVEREAEAQVRRRGGLSHLFGAYAKGRMLMVGRRVMTGARAAATRSAAAIGARMTAGAAVAGVAAAIVIAGRLVSGRSFENMGGELNRLLLGDADDEARAAAAARDRLTSQPDLLRIVGREGQANAQVKSLFEDFRRQQLRQELGRSLLEQDPNFQVQSPLDILIVRAKDWFVSSWNAHGGPAACVDVQAKLSRQPQSTHR